MSLITKRLSSLGSGSQIQVSYGFQDVRSIQATVTDNDNTSCLEVRDSDGCLHYLDYSTVKSLVMLGAAPVPQVVKQPLLHEQEVSYVSLCISDRELKALFDGLDKQEKRLLQKGCDSFFYGVRTSDSEKITAAGETTRRLLRQEEKLGFRWSQGACRLAARMLVRGGIYDGTLFAQGGMWREAAYCHSRSGDFVAAAAPSAMALLEENLSSDCRRNMQIILAKGCVESADTSVLPILVERGQNIQHLTDQLLLAKEVSLPGDAAQKQALLREHYPNTAAGEALERLLAPEAPETRIGTVIKLLWVNNTGTILCRDEQGSEISVPFRYQDMTPELKQRAELAGSDPKKLGGMVRFRLKEGRAVAIEPAPSPMELAQQALTQERHADALDYLRMEVELGGNAGAALNAIAQTALDSDDEDLVRQSLDFCLEHQDAYPTGSKAISLLGRLYRRLGQVEPAVELTEQALKAESYIPAKLHSGLLCQYMSFCVGAYDQTGDEKYLRRIHPKAERWLQIFRENLPDDVNLYRKLSKVLQWKIQSHCAANQAEEAEKTYAELARQFPADTRLGHCAELIRRIRRQREEAAPVSAAAPAMIPDPEPMEASQEPEFEDPGYTDPQEEAVDTVVQVTHALNMDRFESMLAYMKVISLNDAQIRILHDAISHAVNSPATHNRYDRESTVGLMDSGETPFPELMGLCTAASYLRCLFQSPDAPGWLRQSIEAFNRLPQLDPVHEKLTRFLRQTGHDPDRYAPYHRDSQVQGEQALRERAAHLQEMYVNNPPRDSAKFARLIQTKVLAFAGLKQILGCAAAGDLQGLEKHRDAFCQQFNGDGLEASLEKIDTYIIRNWEAAGRMMPSRESATLQGSRRSGLRSALNAIVGLINDYYRFLDEHRSRPLTQQGRDAFQALAPELIRDLEEAAQACEAAAADAASPGERVGLQILKRTLCELGDKLSGRWIPGRERLLFADFLLSNRISLDPELLPDLHGTFRGWEALELKHRIEAHDREPLLTPQEHMDRIFSRDRHYQNFGTARQITRCAAQLGWEVTVPENSERYVNQAQLVAQLDLQELREAIAGAREAGGEMEALDRLEQVLLHFYLRCCQELQFGFLAQITDAIRLRLEEMKGADNL